MVTVYTLICKSQFPKEATVDVMGTKLLHSYGTNELKLLTFEIGNLMYAVNIAKVRESIPLKNNTLVPVSAIHVDYFMGNLNVRGEIIPVVDLPGYLQIKDEKTYGDSMAIIAEYDGRKIAFMVDEISHNISVSWDHVLPPPQSLGSVVTGFVLGESGIIQLIDFEKIRDDIIGSPYQLDSLEKIPIDGITVLYAEDSAHVRKVVSGVLESNNLSVLACENGEVAWQTYQDKHDEISFVISDIEMPLKDGTSLTLDIRNHPNGAQIPIVLMSSMTIEQNVAQYLKIGASAFVPKNQMSQLNTLIQQYVAEIQS